MKRVLIVEDDPWYAQQQQRLLTGAEYDVRHASDAQTAIEMIERRVPDAIVLDVLLAYNTAFVLLHELQSARETADIPVIIYTAQSDMVSNVALKEYGVTAVLDKATMRPDDTVRALRRIGL